MGLEVAMIRHSMWLLVGVGMVGCQGSTDMDHTVAQQAIVGGTKTSGDPGVVLVIAAKPNSQSQSLCTGEIISPHVVLTAAHCVDPSVVGRGNTFTIFLGSDLNSRTDANNGANFVEVKETHFDADFSTNNLEGGHDVGIVITKTAMTATPLPINRDPLDKSMLKQPLRLVGFGVTSGTDANGATAGTKRTTTTTLAYFDTIFVAFNDPRHITCEGDSGGPALLTINGVETIVGITSFGDQGCTQQGVDTRVDSYVDFIDQWTMMFDPPVVPVKPDPSTSTPETPAATPGSLGTSCTDHPDCTSGLCVHSGSVGYCSAACDPAAAQSCGNGTVCGAVDDGHLCVEKAKGCSALPGGHDASDAAPVLLVLAALALLSRRRWAR